MIGEKMPEEAKTEITHWGERIAEHATFWVVYLGMSVIMLLIAVVFFSALVSSTNDLQQMVDAMLMLVLVVSSIVCLIFARKESTQLRFELTHPPNPAA